MPRNKCCQQTFPTPFSSRSPDDAYEQPLHTCASTSSFTATLGEPKTNTTGSYPYQAYADTHTQLIRSAYIRHIGFTAETCAEGRPQRVAETAVYHGSNICSCRTASKPGTHKEAPQKRKKEGEKERKEERGYQSIIGDAGIAGGAGFTPARMLGGTAVCSPAGIPDAALGKRSWEDVRTLDGLDEGKLAGCGGSMLTVGGDGEGSRNPGGGTAAPG